MTAVLVSRFLIDLQTASRKTLRLDSQDSMYMESTAFGVGTLSFARVVGSLGETLDPASPSSSSLYDAGDDDGPSSTEVDAGEDARCGPPSEKSDADAAGSVAVTALACEAPV